MPFSKKELEKLKKWKRIAIAAATNPGSSSRIELDERKVINALNEMHALCLRHYPEKAKYFEHLKRLYYAFATEKINLQFFNYQLMMLNRFYGVR